MKHERGITVNDHCEKKPVNFLAVASTSNALATHTCVCGTLYGGTRAYARARKVSQAGRQREAFLLYKKWLLCRGQATHTHTLIHRSAERKEKQPSRGPGLVTGKREKEK